MNTTEEILIFLMSVVLAACTVCALTITLLAVFDAHYIEAAMMGCVSYIAHSIMRGSIGYLIG